MHATEGERKAAHELAEALVRFIVAANEGAMTRNAVRVKDQIGLQKPRQNQPEPVLVSPRDAAKLLSIGERKLWSLSSPRGPIPVVRLGRSVRYRVSDLAAVTARWRETDGDTVRTEA